MSEAVEADRILMQVAAPRGGICTRAELMLRGLTPGAVDDRVRLGLLKPIRRGVYRVDELANSSTPLHAATMAVSGSVISHLTAGSLHRFAIPIRWDEDPVDLIVPNNTNLRLNNVTLHRQRRPPVGEDVTNIDQLPVTAPARTIIDLSAVVGKARLRHIVQTQISENSPSLEILVACFDAVARRGVKGMGLMRDVLQPMAADGPVGGSKLEIATAELLSGAAIEGFIPQYRPTWFDGREGIVDFAHPQLRIILEADGRRWHRREQEMVNDRRRDRRAATHGWLTLRVTWNEVTRRPGATADELVAIMSARARQLAA